MRNLGLQQPPATLQTHVMPLRTLLIVFAALVVLTIITVAAAQLSLGRFEVWVSLGIATLKASLVAYYFMHLKHDKPLNAVIFLGSTVFVALFLALTLMDLYAG